MDTLTLPPTTGVGGAWDSLAPDEVSALESRADVDSLGDLHARRRQLIQANAPLIALYGPFGLWDPKRKALLESLKVRARMALSQGGKPTEAAIDAAAHADPQYEAFLDQSFVDKIAWIQADTELREIDERIRNRETALHVYGKELSLAR